MDKNLQKLYEAKIKTYESIIYKIKVMDFALIAKFEKEFEKIENINEKIEADQNLVTQRILKFKL